MTHQEPDDLEPALRAMLGDHRLDVRPRGDAVGTVLFGVDRARRRRTTGYAAVTSVAVAGLISGIVLLGGDTPQSIQPIAPTTSTTSTGPDPSTSASASPTESLDPTPSDPPTTQPTTVTNPPDVDPTTSEPPSSGIEPLRPGSIGDIELGMSYEEAFATGTLGEWDGTPPQADCSDPWVRTTPDHAIVWLNRDEGVVEISVFQEQGGPPGSTVEGLRLGDPISRVPEIYPDAVPHLDSYNGTYVLENWQGSGYWLVIRDDSTEFVTGFVVHGSGQRGCYE